MQPWQLAEMVGAFIDMNNSYDDNNPTLDDLLSHIFDMGHD
jgi:hypothetical protein